MNEENNILIAKFMGVDVSYSDIVYKDSRSTLRHFIDNRNKSDGLDFHKSWDWLMPVVEKIELCFDANVVVQITDETCHISYSNNYQKYAVFEKKIDAVYNSCIEFIKWYNNQL